MVQAPHKSQVGIVVLRSFGRMVTWGYAHVQVRIYKKEHGILRRLAFRKSTTIAEVIRQLIKEA
jgi:hypothetical protein